MQISVNGSCLSNLTYSRLDHFHKWQKKQCIHHNRSDAFIKYYVEKSNVPIPLEELDSLLKDISPPIHDARDIILNQLPETIGFFEVPKEKDGIKRKYFEELANEPIDAIFLDNFMDLSSKLLVSKTFEGGKYKDSPMFINPSFYEYNEALANEFEFTPYLTPEESAANWMKIYRFYKKIQSNAKIYFFCFHYDTEPSNVERCARGEKFADTICELAKGSDLKIFRPVSAPERLKIPGDWTHFKWEIYEKLADVVYKDMTDPEANIAFPYELKLPE